MDKFTTQQIVANHTGALAHLLSGQPGRHDEFVEKVEVIVGGSEPQAMQLMQFTGRVRQSGIPVMWIHHMPDAPACPLIGLVAAAGDQVCVIEHCFLWATPNGRTVQLVPDNFKMGAFAFDEQLRLNYQRKAPVRNFAAAQTGMMRAYRRLLQLEREQIVRGDVFRFPELARAA